MVAPARGEIWWFDPDPVRGHEQGGPRPALVVSASAFNTGPQRLAMVLPITRARRAYPYRIELRPEDSGLPDVSYVICDQLRTVTLDRMLDTRPVGRVSESILTQAIDHLRAILEVDDGP
jgi:mRNA interferase MazF